MKKTIVKTVSEYILNSAIESQIIQHELRRIILAIRADIAESISWNVPFYRCNKKDVCGFSVSKNHVTFGAVIHFDSSFRKQLNELGYKTGKQTIQIQFDQSVPVKHIKEILNKTLKIYV